MNKKPGVLPILGSVCLAFVFWYFVFCSGIINFWLGMSVAVTILSLIAYRYGGPVLKRSEFTVANLLRGLLAAAVLYAIFWVGNFLSQSIFLFAKPQVSAIYDIRSQAHPALIALVLLFVTSPGEEFFWRGFLQRWAMDRFGPFTGWLAVSGVYCAVHIVSGNTMLILAALVAGLFWGWLYRRTGSLLVCMLSHALWTVTIFVLFPVL